MKTILFATVYLLTISIMVSAQTLDVALANNSTSALGARNMPDLARLVQSSAEFAPLTNKPFFPGGKQALEKHLESIDLYSNSALKAYSEGTVRVRFRVQPDGCLTDIQVVESCGDLLDAAAIKSVVMMPRWYPAHRAGVAVTSLVELPITFRHE